MSQDINTLSTWIFITCSQLSRSIKLIEEFGTQNAYGLSLEGMKKLVKETKSAEGYLERALSDYNKPSND